jgi:low temperature requirement protein LtrA
VTPEGESPGPGLKGTLDATAEPDEIPQPAERATGPVELLWDLVFVFAITQVSTLLAANLSWTGLGRSTLVLALIWWAWSAFVWATNAQDPDAPTLRAVVLLATILIFLAGLALPRAFGGEATLFAATYAGVRLLHLALYADASHASHCAEASRCTSSATPASVCA